MRFTIHIGEAKKEIVRKLFGEFRQKLEQARQTRQKIQKFKLPQETRPYSGNKILPVAESSTSSAAEEATADAKARTAAKSK